MLDGEGEPPCPHCEDIAAVDEDKLVGEEAEEKEREEVYPATPFLGGTWWGQQKHYLIAVDLLL